MTDIHHQKVVSFMIEKTYSPIIKRVIAIYVCKDINEIQATLKFETQKALSVWDNFRLKQRLLAEILQTDKATQCILFGLKKTSQLKDDILKEIMTQYGIHKGDEATLYHDYMSKIFEKHIETMRGHIERHEYDVILKLVDIKSED